MVKPISPRTNGGQKSLRNKIAIGTMQHFFYIPVLKMAGRVTRRRAVGNIFIERKFGIKYICTKAVYFFSKGEETGSNCIVTAATTDS